MKGKLPAVHMSPAIKMRNRLNPENLGHDEIIDGFNICTKSLSSIDHFKSESRQFFNNFYKKLDANRKSTTDILLKR
jgi:hypothetical protein